MRKLAAVSLVLFLVSQSMSPARAGDGVGGYSNDEPTIAYTSVSWLSPTHLGGHVVVDGSVHGSGGSMKRACWEAWAARRNWMLEQNSLAEAGGLPLPFPEVTGDPTPGVEPANRANPGFCEGVGARVTVPEVVDNTCEAGTVFAVRVHYYWVTGPNYGRFVDSTITLSNVLDERMFNFCLDLFIDEDPVAFLERVPEPRFQRSPDANGVTGLETWLWYDFGDPGSHSVAGRATIDAIEGLPLTLDAQAWVDRVVWDLDGDGEWDRTLEIPDAWDRAPDRRVYLAAGGANSGERAAATYLYETKGDYRVTVGVVWRGTYRFTDPVLSGLLYPYPPVVRTSTFDYPVVEVISRVEDTG